MFYSRSFLDLKFSLTDVSIFFLVCLQHLRFFLVSLVFLWGSLYFSSCLNVQMFHFQNSFNLVFLLPFYFHFQVLNSCLFVFPDFCKGFIHFLFVGLCHLQMGCPKFFPP